MKKFILILLYPVRYLLPNKKKLFLIFYLTCLTYNFPFVTSNLFAQPSITWQRLYHAPLPGHNRGYHICQTTDGNFILAGITNNQSFIVKINGYGDTIWTKLQNSYTRCAVPTPTGGCVLAGANSIIKLDINGSFLWDNTFTNNSVLIYDIKLTQDGGFILCGYKTGEIAYIAKLDSLGNLQWEKSYPPVWIRTFNSVIQDSQGNFVSTGTDWKTFNDTIKIFLVKFNISGTAIWENKYKLNNISDLGLKIQEINQNYLILCEKGITKIDTSGTQLFSTFMSMDSNEGAIDMKVLSGNRYLFATNKTFNYTVKSALKICDTAGNVIRNRNIYFPDYTQLNSLISLNNGDCISLGFTDYDTTNSTASFFAIRTDSLLDAPPLAVNNINKQLPSKFRLSQNYPNPFNPSTKIKYDLPKDGTVSIKIYDILGREIYSINEFEKAGRYEAKFDGTNYASGLYFYRMQVSDPGSKSGTSFIQSKKMVLVK